jgi:phage gpG-like protein
MSVRWEGLDAVNIKLGKLIKLVKNPRRPMTQATAHLQNKMADYSKVPGRPGSSYRRTGTLGRRWTTRIENGGQRGVVGNNTEYAPFVQSKARQRAPFRGRWHTEADVADAEGKTVADFFRQAIRDEIG